MPAVNPDILIWARETAGLSLEAAAKSLGLLDNQKKSGVDKLLELERGDVEPTQQQLMKMSEHYRRSLVIFYLDTPPPRGDRGQDFRALPNTGPTREDALLDALIRDLQMRQSIVRALLEDEEAQPLPFIASAQIEDGLQLVAQRIVSTLQFNLATFRAAKRTDQAFAYLRTQIEKVGIFVLLVGNLGSHHSAISVETFRGFAIADLIAPFVIINSQDSKSAQSFTALHEVVHLWIGATGVSGAPGTSIGTPTEQFCNDVAGEILLPLRELDELHGIEDHELEDAAQIIIEFAGLRHVSRSMVAYKLYRTSMISHEFWERLNAYFLKEWLRFKQGQKEKEKLDDTGGPTYYITQGSRLGSALLHLVNRAINGGMLTSTKAGKVLGIKPRNVDPLLKTVLRQRGR